MTRRNIDFMVKNKFKREGFIYIEPNLPEPNIIEVIDHDQHEQAHKNFISTDGLIKDIRMQTFSMSIATQFKKLIERQAWYYIYIPNISKYVSFNKHKLPSGELDHKANFLDWLRAAEDNGGLHFEPTKLDALLKGTEAWEVYQQFMGESNQNTNSHKFLDSQDFSKIDDTPRSINVKIDEPEETAIKLLEHYKGKNLEKLINMLQQNL